MPGHGVQICARIPTKGYVQTGAHTWAPSTGAKSDLRPLFPGVLPLARHSAVDNFPS